MLSVRGIYDGKKIKPLEAFDVPANVEVIITFMDKQASALSREARTEDFLKLSGSWKDDRSAEEIIGEIYGSRTNSHRDINL